MATGWWKRRHRRTGAIRFRAEKFGAIYQTKKPQALLFTDREFARGLGDQGGEAWQGREVEFGELPLSAPLEAHLQLTNGCSVGCRGCYTGATPRPSRFEWGLEEWKGAVDELAAMKVFHLALGGGESADLPWLAELAEYARARGIVPNLTTSGLSSLDRVLHSAHLFGQINISIDGIGRSYEKVRGVDGFAAADAALRRLREKKKEVGINVVVTRQNFEELSEIFGYAKRLRLSEVEILRFKPAGRGIAAYDELCCTQSQHRRLLPTLRRALRRTRIRTRVDCSYTPMITHHRPSPGLLKRLTVFGCTAGDFLIGVKATGQVTGCSFAPPEPDHPKLDGLRDYWHGKDSFAAFRSWREMAEPCQSCDYLALCRGGCKAVSLHTVGDLRAPDPECPRVVDFHGSGHERTNSRPRKRLPVVI